VSGAAQAGGGPDPVGDEPPSILLTRTDQGAVATVTLRRPHRRNALSTDLLTQLRDTLSSLTREPGRAPAVMILTGAAPSFCSGADTRESCWTDPAARSVRRDRFRDVVDQLHTCSFATLAAVEGHALGGGLELALACDLVVAGESAVFGLPELAVGAVPGGGAVHSLVGRAGRGFAAHLLLTGARASAAEMLAAHAIERVVADGAALSEAARLAAGMLRCRATLPVAVRLLRDSGHLARTDALAMEEGYFWRAALRSASAASEG